MKLKTDNTRMHLIQQRADSIAVSDARVRLVCNQQLRNIFRFFLFQCFALFINRSWREPIASDDVRFGLCFCVHYRLGNQRRHRGAAVILIEALVVGRKWVMWF